MNKLFFWLLNPPPDGPKSTLLLRLMAGGVFFWEGLLKFVYVNQGVGRFTKLGIPFPHFTAAFVGYLEIFGGLLLITGLMTRAIAIPFRVGIDRRYPIARSRNEGGDSEKEGGGRGGPAAR